MKKLIGLIIALSASRIGLEDRSSLSLRFVIWNIGQGQWTTMISKNFCDHYDMGGEIDLSRRILHECEGRQHRLHISHWDWDHMGLVQNMRWRGASICLWNYPLGPASSRKKRTLEGLPACQALVPYRSIFSGDRSPKASSNDSSQVVLVAGILIPGDSTKKEERRWALSTQIHFAHGIVLGHHGSRSSTSDYLLDQLPGLQWAVATARRKRYGHPHPEVIQRLRDYKIPLLITEDWGNLVFEL